MPDDIILCTLDVAGLYLNTPYNKDLPGLRKRAESRKEKHVSTAPFMDLAEVVLKISLLTTEKKTFTQK